MNWGPLVGVIGSWLAALGITGAVAAGAAWALFQWFGKKWVEEHFSRELEAFKAEKQVELEKLRTEYGRETERLKADLNRFADRASRFHNREYEVLPEAWGLMNKAYGAAMSAISAFQQHADLNSMGEAQLEAWLEQSDLEQYQRDELRTATDRNTHYGTLRDWKQIGDADRAAIEFSNYVVLHGVFIEEPLSTKMMDAAQNMRKALISRSMVERLKGMPYQDGQTNYWQEAIKEIEAVKPVVLEVKNEVRNLLSNIRLTDTAG